MWSVCGGQQVLSECVHCGCRLRDVVYHSVVRKQLCIDSWVVHHGGGLLDNKLVQGGISWWQALLLSQVTYQVLGAHPALRAPSA